MYEVVLSRAAERAYRNADAPLTRKLERCFQQLESNPRAGNNIKPLKGPLTGLLRYRVGDYRVVYSVTEAVMVVSVLTIVHRREAYE